MEVKRFLGMVNFYWDLWTRCLHTLAPLKKLLAVKKKSNFYLGVEELKAFEEAKWMLGNNALLVYPDFPKPFNIYLDASDYQLGATVFQNGRPLGFYTRKLSASQKYYTVGEGRDNARHVTYSRFVNTSI